MLTCVLITHVKEPKTKNISLNFVHSIY